MKYLSWLFTSILLGLLACTPLSKEKDSQGEEGFTATTTQVVKPLARGIEPQGAEGFTATATQVVKPLARGIEPQGAEEVEATGATTYLIPSQKSIHLFDLPENVSEADLLAGINSMNQAIENLGYPGVGYHIYKVESDSIGQYTYYMEGLWPDPETYKIIHESEAWKTAAEASSEIFDSIMQDELYRRVVKVN